MVPWPGVYVSSKILVGFCAIVLLFLSFTDLWVLKIWKKVSPLLVFNLILLSNCFFSPPIEFIEEAIEWIESISKSHMKLSFEEISKKYFCYNCEDCEEVTSDHFMGDCKGKCFSLSDINLIKKSFEFVPKPDIDEEEYKEVIEENKLFSQLIQTHKSLGKDTSSLFQQIQCIRRVAVFSQDQ